jgi:lysophospholipase L1-like esterase
MPIPYAPDQYYSNERIALYDKEIEILCEGKKMPYFGLSAVMTAEDLEDGIHPNAKGHEKICTVVRAFLAAEK